MCLLCLFSRLAILLYEIGVMVLSIAERIKEERERAGLTQEELAAKARVSPVTISVWENGKRTPKIASLQKLATALDVSVDVFILDLPQELPSQPVGRAERGRDRCSEDDDVYISKITLMLRDMSEEQKLKVLQYAFDQKQINDLKRQREG